MIEEKPNEKFEDILNETFEDIISEDNPHAYSMLPMVSRLINQFKISNCIEAHIIVHETYLMARDHIRQGGEIDGHKAWLKWAALNIIREKKRIFDQQSLADQNLGDLNIDIPQSRSNIPSQMVDQDLRAFWKAMEKLEIEDPEATQLIYWRLVDRLTWEEIQENLKKQGKIFSKKELRQLAFRIKRRLRRIFHAVN